MPPKTKKGGLKEEQILATVNIVKQYWPDYPITPASIRNPSRDFILNLYRDCVKNLEEKLAFATRSQLLPYPPGLGEEELLYLKLSRIPSLVKVGFKLGDLYSVDPFRVNSHIFVIMHFLTFTDTIMDKTVQICNTVLDAKEKMQGNQEELKQLREEILQKQIKLTQVKSENKKAKEEAVAIAPEYEIAMASIEDSEKKCKDKFQEMDKIKHELESIQEKIQKLEKSESNLRGQIVTEEEYTKLKNTLESLENEDKNLEETELSNGLIEQKLNIEHLQTCLRELNHLELSEDVFKLSNYRRQLKDEEENVQYALNIQKTSGEMIKALKIQLENEKRTIEKQKKELQEQLKMITENGMLKKIKLKNQYQQMTQNHQIEIDEQNRILEEREADHKRLQKGLNESYKSIYEKQDMALKRYKAFTEQVNKIIKEHLHHDD